MKDKLSIITTLVNSKSQNRMVSLERFISYHSRLNCKIIVVCPEDVDISRVDTRYENLKIIPCKSSLLFEEKLFLASKEIDTPYCCWAPDDDFLGLDYAKKSIEELNKNLFVSATNAMMIFYDEKSIKRSKVDYGYNAYKNALKKGSISHKGKIFRSLANAFHCGPMQGIVRKEAFESLVYFLCEYKMPSIFFDRIFPAIFMLHGDIVYIKSISKIRSDGTRLATFNPKLWTSMEIPAREMVMREDIIQGLYKLYEKINNVSLTPGIKADILYFILKSSFALNDYESKSLKRKFKKICSFIGGYFEPLKLSFFNKTIKEDIRLAKWYMKKYSLKAE